MLHATAALLRWPSPPRPSVEIHPPTEVTRAACCLACGDATDLHLLATTTPMSRGRVHAVRLAAVSASSSPVRRPQPPRIGRRLIPLLTAATTSSPSPDLNLLAPAAGSSRARPRPRRAGTADRWLLSAPRQQKKKKRGQRQLLERKEQREERDVGPTQHRGACYRLSSLARGNSISLS
jgi:hypothetical protein